MVLRLRKNLKILDIIKVIKFSYVNVIIYNSVLF